MTLRERVLLRRNAIECMVRYGTRLTTKEMSIALNVHSKTILRDIQALDKVWLKDGYLYYVDTNNGF